ncbi:MAG: VCBS repeat-containing protein [Candidatus Latescibacteria bacterium]|nr:VCBS repeat-containing protein [Candidatus Latescibacterota bacterium]
MSVTLVCGWLLLAAIPVQAQTFTDITGTAGIANPLRGPGLAWGDYDGDGDLDLYITAWTLVGGSPLNKLYRNNGDATFTEVATTAGVAGFNNFSSSGAWADYNNDGKLDLYVTNFLREEQDFLYQNLGGGRFGIQLPNTVKGNPLWAAWGDYNLDGNLDFYLARFNGENLLFKNNGNNTFTNVTTAAKVGDVRDSDRASWVDYDNDGDPDLFVVNHNQESQLFRNKGDGTFENVTATAGVGSAGIGKHSAWADYDTDGDLDLFVANIGANILYQNNGNGTFTRVSVPAGVAQTGTAWVHWFAGWADYDLDGKSDLFIASGAESAAGERSTLFANNGNGTFTDVTPVSFVATDSSAASAWGDYDNDGDPDLYVLNYGSDRLYLNGTAPSGGNAFLKVRPFRTGKAPSDSSADGIGAKIWVYDAGTTTLRGYQEIISAADALEALFGLPAGGTYDVVVQFTSRNGTPGGAVVIDKNDNATKYGGIAVAGGKTLIVKENENTVFP